MLNGPTHQVPWQPDPSHSCHRMLQAATNDLTAIRSGRSGIGAEGLPGSAEVVVIDGAPGFDELLAWDF